MLLEATEDISKTGSGPEATDNASQVADSARGTLVLTIVASDVVLFRLNGMSVAWIRAELDFYTYMC